MLENCSQASAGGRMRACATCTAAAAGPSAYPTQRHWHWSGLARPRSVRFIDAVWRCVAPAWRWPGTGGSVRRSLALRLRSARTMRRRGTSRSAAAATRRAAAARAGPALKAGRAHPLPRLMRDSVAWDRIACGGAGPACNCCAASKQGARGENTGGDFFVENVIEELDYPSEFYYDKRACACRWRARACAVCVCVCTHRMVGPSGLATAEDRPRRCALCVASHALHNARCKSCAACCMEHAACCMRHAVCCTSCAARCIEPCGMLHAARCALRLAHSRLHVSGRAAKLYLFYNGTGPPPADATVVAPQLRTLVNMTVRWPAPASDARAARDTALCRRAGYHAAWDTMRRTVPCGVR